MTEFCQATRLLYQFLPGQTESEAWIESFSDWKKLMQLGRSHGIPGILLANLPSHTPETVLDELRSRQKKARIRGLWLQRSAVDVMTLLRNGGIQKLSPLKGTHLLPLLYGDYGMRTTNDVDLLVSPSDFDRAHELLVSGGFRYLPKPEGRPASQRANYERSYQAPEGHVIDVHRGLCQVSRITLDYDGIWTRSRRLEEGDLAGFDRLHDSDVLLTLMVHIGQDNFQGPFRQWWDVALLLQRSDFQWSDFLDHARTAGAGTLVWCVLHRLNWMGVGLTSQKWQELAPRGIRERYLRRLLEQQTVTPLSFQLNTRRAQALTTLPVMDGWGRRVRFVSEYLSLRLKDPFQSVA